MLAPEQLPDDIWSDPERVLAPTKEDRFLKGMEELSEERLYACWADESLRVCIEYLSKEPCNPYATELFTRTRSEINQYIALIDELMEWLLGQLRLAGRGCNPELFGNPRSEIEQHITAELSNETDPDSSTRFSFLTRFLAMCEYAGERVARFVSRFTDPKYELLEGYPTNDLKAILLETRAELANCQNIVTELWESEMDQLPEPPEITLPPDFEPAPEYSKWDDDLIELNRAVKARPAIMRR